MDLYPDPNFLPIRIRPKGPGSETQNRTGAAMGWDGMGCSSSAIYPNFLFVAAANGSTTNFCTSSPLGARRLTLPVECVGENCVAKADGGGKDVDGRDAGAGHDRGLVPWGREKRAVTDNTQLQTRVEEEISFI